jgi:hypothetical protein
MFPCQLCLRKRDLRTIGAAGNIIIDMGVLLSEDFNKSTQRNSAERWARKHNAHLTGLIGTTSPQMPWSLPA